MSTPNANELSERMRRIAARAPSSRHPGTRRATAARRRPGQPRTAGSFVATNGLGLEPPEGLEEWDGRSEPGRHRLHGRRVPEPGAADPPPPPAGPPLLPARLRILLTWGRWELTAVPVRRWEWFRALLGGGVAPPSGGL